MESLLFDVYQRDKKNESVTFRIDKDTLDRLRSHSGKERISLNTLVNQILCHYLEWDIIANTVGWVPMPRQYLIELLNSLEDKTIQEIASRVAQNSAKEIILCMRGQYNLEEYLALLKCRAKVSGFSLTERIEDDHHMVIMQHDMGIKWSIFFRSVYDTIFQDLGTLARFDITDNAVIFKIIPPLTIPNNKHRYQIA